MAPSSGFIFVNKTAHSSLLTRSDGLERSRIFSHAQRRRPVRDSEDFVVTTLKGNIFIQNDIPSRSASFDRRKKKKKAAPPLIELVPSNLDPFQSFSVSLDEGMQSMLAYYLNSIVPSIFPLAHVATEAKRHIVVHAAEDAAVLYGVLGVANATVSALSGHERYSRDFARFRHQTLVQVHKAIGKGEEKVQATTAYAVALLLRIECGQGDIDVVKIHFDGLIKMMELVDAPSEIAFPLLLAVQACLNLCAVTMQTSPHIVTSRSSQGIQSMLPGTTPAMSSKFALPQYRAIIGEELFDIISRWHDLKFFRQYIAKERVQLTSAQVEALNTEPLTLEHRLLSMKIRESTAASCNPARNAIRLALYVLSGPPIPGMSKPGNPFRKSLGEQLKCALEESEDLGLWQPCLDMSLWALFVAAHVCYQQKEWEWIISRTALVCKELGIEGLTALEAVLMEFDLDLKRFGDLQRVMWMSMQETESCENRDSIVPSVYVASLLGQSYCNRPMLRLIHGC